MQKIKMKGSRVLMLATMYASVVFLFLFFYSYQKEDRVANIAPRYKLFDKSFAYLPIGAKAVYVFDYTMQDVLYKKNENIPMPLASITKVATALCALNKLGPDEIVAIEKSDLLSEGISSLRPGERWRIGDLASYMLVESSNDAAVALGRAYGGSPAIVSCMNAEVERLGLFDTKFANETGLDIGNSPGAYGSAENVALLFASAIKRYPNIFESTRKERYNAKTVSGANYVATNTDRAIADITGFVASKTGYTDLAGGNLVFAMDAGLGHKVLVVILGSTEEGRFTDAKLLSDAVISTLSANK